MAPLSSKALDERSMLLSAHRLLNAKHSPKGVNDSFAMQPGNFNSSIDVLNLKLSASATNASVFIPNIRNFIYNND
jgi:hypothetical protein